eukprot:CAMPEP_0181288130 /NCGR_PEP_ID=MMETSP1101-20121128/164_1 /TAXON_ID=46948 /ORGANISM="Rhodomonas abbreviata, Strain Caron Lab Isolate" /LENGTH=350 /DNA_ID=CAMNT_0023392223 /DNA_START=102 /DNA_END=1154 /DNA_ORIENTATION=+
MRRLDADHRRRAEEEDDDAAYSSETAEADEWDHEQLSSRDYPTPRAIERIQSADKPVLRSPQLGASLFGGEGRPSPLLSPLRVPSGPKPGGLSPKSSAKSVHQGSRSLLDAGGLLEPVGGENPPNERRMVRFVDGDVSRQGAPATDSMRSSEAYMWGGENFSEHDSGARILSGEGAGHRADVGMSPLRMSTATAPVRSSRRNVRFVDGDVMSPRGRTTRSAGILKVTCAPLPSPEEALGGWSQRRTDPKASELKDVARTCMTRYRAVYRDHMNSFDQTLAAAHKRLNSNPSRTRQRKRAMAMSGEDSMQESVECIMALVAFIILVALLLAGMVWETHFAAGPTRNQLPAS